MLIKCVCNYHSRPKLKLLGTVVLYSYFNTLEGNHSITILYNLSSFMTIFIIIYFAVAKRGHKAGSK